MVLSIFMALMLVPQILTQFRDFLDLGKIAKLNTRHIHIQHKITKSKLLLYQLIRHVSVLSLGVFWLFCPSAFHLITLAVRTAHCC